MAYKADLILHNAKVLTLDSQTPRAEFVAIKGDKIIGLGSKDELEIFRGAKTKLINCKGKTIIPGFNDAHIHLFALASTLLSIDCSPSSVSSIAEIQAKIREKARQVPQNTWIKGADYNEFYLAEKRHPNRWDLDQAAPNHPVRLLHRSRHACVLNSLGLSLAGISSQTPDPPGGLIDRDPETGEPTGILFGMNSYLNQKVIPPLTEKELEEGLKLVNQKLISLGITSLQEATWHNDLSRWQKFQQIKKEGKLKPRITMMFGFDALAEFQELGMTQGYGDNELRLGMVKLPIDETRGPLNPPQEILNEQVFLVHKAGYQVAIHAVEENTVRAAVRALKYALEQLPEAEHRHRIEHCSECPPYLLQQIRQVRPLIVTQPAFLYYSGERYLSEVPQSQLPWLYRIKSLWNSGLILAAGSDSPVSPPNPLIGIYAAVTRKSEVGQTLSPEESISPLQALWMYTMGGAYASLEENLKGSLAVGKLADLVVLSADPTQVPAEEIKNISVEKTIIGGEVVWERG